jgi:TM2 domain-containing membrane protein YozV
MTDENVKVKPVEKKKPTQGIAIAALLLNILVLPGLGTIIGGRTKHGVIQLVLFIIGIPLAFVIVGIPLMIAMWIWALVSAIQILKEAG